MSGRGARMVEVWSVDVSLSAAETRQTIVTGNWTRRCYVKRTQSSSVSCKQTLCYNASEISVLCYTRMHKSILTVVVRPINMDFHSLSDSHAESWSIACIV